jgi:hypothetical protein
MERFVRLTDFTCTSKHYLAVGALVNWNEDSFEAVAEIIPAKAVIEMVGLHY